MRNLVVCCDGTWNTPDQKEGDFIAPTNVAKLFNLLASVDDDSVQRAYYRQGVGTEGNFIKRAWEGGTGAGLSLNIKSAYRWISDHYRDDDRLFLFGFSRGAYTVRSLASFLWLCGIPDLSTMDDERAWQVVDTAFDLGYVPGGSAWWEKYPGMGFKAAPKANVAIHFLGVWDTVGSVGIPDDLALINGIEKLVAKVRKRPLLRPFKDNVLGNYVKTARQAIALDEKRASFVANLWTDYDSRKSDVVQLWFPGVHSDVGGGYLEKGLADGALQWMVDESVKHGLIIDSKRYSEGVKPDYQGIIHDSFAGVFRFLPTHPRSFPDINQTSHFHASAIRRHQSPPLTEPHYKYTIKLDVGQEANFSIFAVNPWNYTGLYMEAGQGYEMAAQGQWMDASIKCGPAGTKDGSKQIGKLAHLAVKPLEGLEKLWIKLSNNPHANFIGTRRYPDYDWMALIGAIANGGNPLPDGTPLPHETHLIGNGATLTVAKSGYFYAFANDAWRFYGNNKGSVRLRVKRIN